MSKKIKVLVFSVSVGTGHTRAAEALKEAVESQYPGSQVKIIDTFQDTRPFLGKIIFGTYLFSIKRMPLFYSQIYNKADEGNQFSSFSKGKFNHINKFFTKSRLLRIIADFKPDIIICTHPFALGIMSVLKAEKHIDKPLAAVITDYIIHPYWLYKNTDMYFVAVREQKEGLVARGIPADRVQVTGIPIHPHFSLQINREKVKKELGLENDLPVVLVMGGGMGIGPVEKIVKFLAANRVPAQLLVVAGKNGKLRRRMEKLSATSGVNMKLFGFVNNVHELMAVSDLFITKPGGLTVAEALAMGLPMLLTKPIPGHEEKNAEYLMKAGVAYDARNEKDLLEIFNRWIQEPDNLRRIRQKAVSIGRPGAARAIAEALVNPEGGVKEENDCRATISG